MGSLDSTITEIDRLIDEGSIEEAIRVSAEAVAAADRRWADARNNGQPSALPLMEALITGSRHVEALALGGQLREAYSTALLLLMMEAIGSDAPAAEPRLVIQYLASRSFSDMMNRSAIAADEDATTHASAIISILGSMLYDTYMTLNAKGSSNPYLKPSFDILKELREIGAIQYPAVNVNGTEIPTDNRGSLIGDVIGRSRAMGWFVCD